MGHKVRLRKRLQWGIGVGVLPLFILACGPRKPPTPAEFNAWSEFRFPADVLSKVKDGRIRFEGGDGTSCRSAVVIAGADGDRDGVPSEYLWIARKHGIQGRDWQLVLQSVSRPDAQGKRFDILTVDIAGEWFDRNYCFDITDFFGRETKWFPASQGSSHGGP